jgi:hypothetical protein
VERKTDLEFVVDFDHHSEIRRVVGQTAAGVYGFDWNFLESVAGKIGPLVDEIMRPLEPAEWPSVPDETVAHIFMAGMAPM